MFILNGPSSSTEEDHETGLKVQEKANELI